MLATTSGEHGIAELRHDASRRGRGPNSQQMSKDEQACKALQYLLDEGFISLGYIDGKPAVYLTTSLLEARKAITKLVSNDSADWWK
jgi:hypothetical protein